MQKNGKNGRIKVLMVRRATLLLVTIYVLTMAGGSAEKKSTSIFRVRGRG